MKQLLIICTLVFIACDNISDSLIMPPSKIVFLRAVEDRRDIFSINRDGSGERNLTNNHGYYGKPVATPDGRRIVFDVVGEDSSGSPIDAIIAMDSDGSNQRVVMDNFSHGALHDVSPDGYRVLLAGVVVSGGYRQIHTMNINSGRLVRLSYDHFLSTGNPQFSPDGSLVVFDGFKEDFNEDIYLTDPFGDFERRLTTSVDSETDPHFIENGEKILYTEFSSAGYYSLCTIDIFGRYKQVLEAGFNSQKGIAVSNGGDKIAFFRWRDRTEDLIIMNSDGSGRRRLAALPHAFSPVFSPDDSELAMVIGETSPFWEIYTIDIASSKISRLTHNNVRDTSPVYLPF